MNAILYILFTYLFVVDYLVLRTPILPKNLGIIPELFSGVILLVVLANFAKNRVLNISTKYILFFAFFLLFLLIGIIVNQVQPGAVFWGIRKYFRYAPLFMLPLVYNFSDKEIGRLIKLLLYFSLLQLPVAIYQKLVLFKINPSGDVIQGTVIGSGHVAVYLICSISIALAYYLKGKVVFKKFVLIMVILFLPIGITEASAALFLLPIIFISPVLFMDKSSAQFKKLSSLMVMGVVFFAGFIAIYNYQYSSRWDGNILNAIIEGQVFKKLYKEASDDSVGEQAGVAKMAEIGRVDSMLLPIDYLKKKGSVSVLVGVGIGNASDSFSDLLQGEYYWTVSDKNSDITTIGNMLWEVGVMGVLLSYLLIFMIFIDAKALQRSSEHIGTIALGWLGVLLVLVFTLPYTNILGHNVSGYLMWFFFGLIIAKASIFHRNKRYL